MKIKIALLQMMAVEERIEENLWIADKFCREAAKAGAQIAVFPEMFSIGYPIPYSEDNSLTYWQEVAFENKLPDPRKITDKYRNYAIDDQHEYLQHFRKLASELNIAIAITYMSQGKQFPRNTVLLIDRFGKDVMKYSKTHFFAPLFIDAICEPGGEFFVKELNTQVGPVKLGALICADRNLPEPARILMKLGAEIVIIPNACSLQGMNGIIFDAVKIRAYENAMAIAICNYPAPKNDGASAAFNPDGTIIFKANSDEQLCIFEYDLDAIRNYRAQTAEGDAFREECYFGKILGGKSPQPFQGRLNAIGKRPEQYTRNRDT